MCKIVIVGDPMVGKTSLLIRFVERRFNPAYIVSIGMTPMSKTITVNNMKVNFIIWDIGGQEAFDPLRAKYYAGAKGGFIVCDVTRKKTLERVEYWYTAVREVTGDIPLFLLCNKIDLINSIDDIEDDVKKVAEKLSLPYYFTSCKTGEHVDESFHMLGKKILESTGLL